MAERDTVELLDTFFAAIERADLEAVAALYHEDVAVWHNVTGEALDKARSLDLLRYWCGRVTGLRYELLERNAYDEGAVSVTSSTATRTASRSRRTSASSSTSWVDASPGSSSTWTLRLWPPCSAPLAQLSAGNCEHVAR